MAAVGKYSSPGRTASADLMQEKLERWRQMKGRTKTGVSAAVINVNRSRTLTKISTNLNISEKRKIIEPPVNTHLPGKVKIGCKRNSDHSSKLAGVIKRSKTQLAMQSKPLPDRGVHCKNKENIYLEANQKTYKDKSLSMRERLELWRAEKRKEHSRGMNNDKKLEKLMKGPTQVSGLKKNVTSYHKLTESTNRVCKSSIRKPLLHDTRKPTTERKSYHPQSAKKCSVKKSCKYKKLDSKFEGKDEMAEIGSEMKSYKDKTLDLSERLELWLAAKGKTPKFKTPAILKNRRSILKHELQEKKRLSFSISEELDSVQYDATGVISPGEGENVEEQLQKCLQQIDKGECDPDRAAAKLDLYNSSCPHTSQIALYWLCRAKIAERERDYDRVVCLFEQAFVFKAQPESLIKDAFCAFVKTMKENVVRGNADDASEIPLSSPVKDSNATAAAGNSPDNFNSSIVKFCLTEATPYRKRFKAAFGKSVLTPVRRSIRLERASIQHPTMLQEHDLTVRSLGELPESVHGNLWFKPNFAVQAELNEAWSKLQRDCNQS